MLGDEGLLLESAARPVRGRGRGDVVRDERPDAEADGVVRSRPPRALPLPPPPLLPLLLLW